MQTVSKYKKSNKMRWSELLVHHILTIHRDLKIFFQIYDCLMDMWNSLRAFKNASPSGQMTVDFR